jgi:hypothetical protein
MRVSVAWRWLCPLAASCLLGGCDDPSGPAGPHGEEEIPPDIVSVTGTVSTPLGNRVEFVNVRLYGVYGDTLNPSFELLAHDTTDATGAFEVEYDDCHAYPRFFIDLEIGCFPIGLREVGCGVWVFDFIWNRPGGMAAPAYCVAPERPSPTPPSSPPWDRPGLPSTPERTRMPAPPDRG